jgi:hypothetical protein
MKEILWKQVTSRLLITNQKYSEKLMEFITMTLREDVRVRPNWNYLKMWIIKNKEGIDVAPCVFWSI